MSDDEHEQHHARRGRPFAADPLCPVTMWLRQADYDRLSAIARTHSQSISSILRHVVTLHLHPPPDRD
jgi:hypothetical protein